MARGLKIAIWAVVLVACAAAGAVVASRTDPFPPGVEDPGARPTGSTSPTGSPGPSDGPDAADVSLGLRVESEHELHVGGTCQSSWSGVVPLRFTSGDHLRGEGEIVLDTGGCAFGTAQVQTVLVVVEATGTLDGDLLRVRFQELSSAPAGSQDLGGFVATLGAIRPSIRMSDGRGVTTVRIRRPDDEGGQYSSVTRISARCRSC